MKRSRMTVLALLLSNFAHGAVLGGNYRGPEATAEARQAALAKMPELEKVEARLPRVLYSWVGPNKLAALIKQLQGPAGGFRNTIYAARTPLSTFAYGPILLRIKLKPLQYEVREEPEMGDHYFTPPGSQEDTIIGHLRQANGAPLKVFEYAIPNASSGVIESISYSTPEIQSEMERERKLIDDPRDFDLDLAFRDERGPLIVTASSSTFDEHPWSQEIFNQRFQEIRSQIEAKTGKVIYMPGVDPVKSPHFLPDDLQNQMISPVPQLEPAGAETCANKLKH
jgi:hypothetical protein